MRLRRLERSCGDWVASSAACGGVQRLQAWFGGAAYGRHRHDTYAIGVTESGVQSFWYRGTVHSAVPGDVVVLHPDEAHDGYAGTDAGFGYRLVYIEPALIAEACGALPFVSNPVVRDPALARRLREAFDEDLTPAASDALAGDVAQVLLARVGGALPVRVDHAAVERATALIHASTPRVLNSPELEAASGLSRFQLARQFRARYGTSPYRYALMRRLDWARARLREDNLADAALEAGFADQAHFTRAFTAAYGVPPGRYARLKANEMRA